MEKRRFEVTNEHLKLLASMSVCWNHYDFGAPTVDPKRPYGDGLVVRSMMKILGVAPDAGDDDLGVSDATFERMCKLHESMKTVLQILIDNATVGVGTGVYVSDEYGDGRRWKRAD